MQDLKKIREQDGFTLVEAIIIIAIIGVMGLIAIPNLLSVMPTYRLKEASRDLYSNMQRARMEAVKENKRWGIIFDETGDKYTVCSSWDAAGGYFEEKVVNLEDYGSGVSFGGDGVADVITFTSDKAVFSTKGVGTPGYVYLTNNRNLDFRVGTQSGGHIILQAEGEW